MYTQKQRCIIYKQDKWLNIKICMLYLYREGKNKFKRIKTRKENTYYLLTILCYTIQRYSTVRNKGKYDTLVIRARPTHTSTATPFVQSYDIDTTNM